MNAHLGAIEDQIMTEQEAADYLRIKPRQLYNWRIKGLVPYIRIGRALRFRKSAIDSSPARMTRGMAS
jgi:excisionase family DNA binding protein